MRADSHRIILKIAAFILVSFPCALRAELKPDEIVLIVNRKSPDSAQLADFYVKARNIPAGRIIELDLPITDEISFDQYEREVVPQVRKFLNDHGLKQQVRCLVSMYGVPLRIADRTNSPAEKAELANLQRALQSAMTTIVEAAGLTEQLAITHNATFQPGTSQTLEGLTQRIDRASQSLILAAQHAATPTQRDEIVRELTDLHNRFRSPMAKTLSDPTPAPSTETALSSPDLVERRFDPVARRELRANEARRGLIYFARLLDVQVDYLTTDSSGAAFDNELAMLWWRDYPRSKWVPNFLNYHYAAPRDPPVLMTMRLDAPTPQGVRDIIATSIEIERVGLRGRVVVDSGASTKIDPEHKQPPYAAFDRQLLDFAAFVRQKTKLDLVLDEKPDVMPANSVKDVALYVGWYSVGHYIPTCSLARGAVAYHVASFEMTSLHTTSNLGWCRGLLRDGAVVTIGPVFEPFLHAFVLPNEFYPLLMTGKVTLAEVYWETNPLASWQMCIVGDPLYTPFRVNPAVQVSDLPPALEKIFQINSQSQR